MSLIRATALIYEQAFSSTDDLKIFDYIYYFGIYIDCYSRQIV